MVELGLNILSKSSKEARELIDKVSSSSPFAPYITETLLNLISKL